jgi:hypothetical protein
MCWTSSYTRQKTKTNTQKQQSTICVEHHHTQDTRRRQTHKNTTQYVLDTIMHKTQDEDKHTKTTEHNMCWTPSYTRQKTKTNKQKQQSTICVEHHHTQDTRRRQTHKNNRAQYVLNTIIHKTQDEDKHTKTTEHNMCRTSSYTRHKTKTNTQKQQSTICVGHHHTQDTRRRQTNKNNRAQYVLNIIIHKTQDEDKHTKTQHNMCWTSSYTRQKTKTNTQKHNTICVGHHHTQDTRRRQTHKNNRAQYVLDIIIHKTEDEDKQTKTTEHNMC